MASMPDIRGQGGGTYFLGRYRVVDEIGIGGMASVHLARMDGPGGFQKWVAIKKIHPHLVEDESFVQMFLDEARVAARISHPNVATVFDLGKHEDTYWIAMEYLHGEPLREVMRRTEELGTAMPPEIACRVIADAAEGLHAAHELLGKNGEKLGLVHRDVTPHNLFVTYDGVTKVVDFGIAKFSSRMSHTRAGTLKGKLAYMSPEQVHGEGIDRRTDIFALGVVLWELTTGQRLFRMESDLDTLAKVQECNVPRPSTLIRGYPVDLEKIVMKALAKNRGERFRTAREFSRALQSLLMRRGLFIASDEVSAYTQSIFNDRIQKREAHLRWASEVTQTINVEQLLSKPKIGPEYTSSEVQSQQPPKPGGVRPAAGMPAALSSPSGETGVPGYGEVSDELKSTGPSLTAPRAQQQQHQPQQAYGAPPRPNGGPRPPQGPPRPAAGAPPAIDHAPPPPPSDEDMHPADGDGPTIQALPPSLEELGSAPALMLGRDLMRGEPPTVMEPMPGSRTGTEGPTMMASPGARARLTAPAAAPSDEAMAIEPEDDFEEDQDQTMVAATRGDSGPLHAPPTFPQPSGGGGRGQDARGSGPSAPPRPQPNRFASTAQMPPQMPPMRNPLGYPMQGQGPQHTGEIAFSETMGVGQGGHGMGDADFGARTGPSGQMPVDFGSPRSGPHPTGPGGELIPRTSARMQLTVPRLGAPSYDNRTMTAQRLKRRPPMWVVAALSCSIALLITGVVLAIVSSTSSPAPAPTAKTTGAATSGAATTGAATTGPFGSARSAFNTVVTTVPPSGALTPPAGGAGTPPVITAATNVAAAPEPPPVASPPAATTTTTAAAPATQTVTTTAATQTAATSRPAPVAPPTPVTAVAAPAAAPPKKPAALGAITVVCMPKCDQIIDNGSPLGPGHIFNRPVPSGKHTLQLSAPNGVKKNLIIEVVPDQTREVRMSMDK